MGSDISSSTANSCDGLSIGDIVDFLSVVEAVEWVVRVLPGMPLEQLGYGQLPRANQLARGMKRRRSHDS